MAAPTNAAYVKKALANSEPSNGKLVECPLLRRCWGTSGPPIYELWRRRPLNVAAHRKSASARLLASERICSCAPIARAPRRPRSTPPAAVTRRPEASATPQRVQCPIVLRLAARRDVQSCRARRNRQPDRAAIPSVDHLRSEVTQRPRRHRIDVSHHETTGAGLHLNRCGLGRRSALTCVPHLGRAPATGRATAMAGRRCLSARTTSWCRFRRRRGRDRSSGVAAISGWPTLRVTASTTKPGSGRARGTSSVRGAVRGLGMRRGLASVLESSLVRRREATLISLPRPQRPERLNHARLPRGPALRRASTALIIEIVSCPPGIDRPHAIGEKPRGCNDCEEGSHYAAFFTSRQRRRCQGQR